MFSGFGFLYFVNLHVHFLYIYMFILFHKFIDSLLFSIFKFCIFCIYQGTPLGIGILGVSGFFDLRRLKEKEQDRVHGGVSLQCWCQGQYN